MGSLLLKVERVSLWAKVALHLWGVRVTGLAAKWTKYICLEVDNRCRRSFEEDVEEESKRP